MKLKRIFINSIQEWSGERPLSLLGPTGSGKTSTLLNFLRTTSLKPLLVSLDSVAAYQELDIGSSKPLGANFSDFDWQGIGFLSPKEKVSASLLKKEVLPRVEKAREKKQSIVFIGGTHFYERFLLEGAAPGMASEESYLRELAGQGKEKVYELLKEKDPRWAEFLHVNDEYRIFRYADLVLRQGFDFDTLREGSQNALFAEVDCLVLNSEKEELNKKLQLRIAEMFAQGWLEETRGLVARYGAKAPALNSVGYAEIVNFLASGKSADLANLAALREEIFIRHRQLAKQQRTWLRSLIKVKA